MSDTIDKFVKQNRDLWDNRDPRPGIWNAISDALFGNRKVFILDSINFWRIAAFLLLGVSAFLFFSKPGGLTGTKPMVQQQEFTDVESFYSAQITEKVAMISREGSFLDDSFTQDLQKLEAMYTVLAEEMQKRPSERVKDALVLNMLVRIDLLNQQIQKLEESKRPKVISSI